jgi:hypothetical protein
MTEVIAQIKGPSMALPAAHPDESTAIISMIERAARDPAIDLDRMERLLAMHKEMKADRAKAAFNAALAQLQSELPPVARKGTGHNDRRYARFEDFIEAIRPKLKEHGFSLTHRIEQPTLDRVIITAVLAHRDGHEERTSLNLPMDVSGGKTAVHAMASSVSYGKRYTGFAITGIASEDEDDDGKAAGAGQTISEEQRDELVKMMDAKDFDMDRVAGFCKHFKVPTIDDLPAAKFEDAKAAIAKARRAP